MRGGLGVRAISILRDDTNVSELVFNTNGVEDEWNCEISDEPDGEIVKEGMVKGAS